MKITVNPNRMELLKLRKRVKLAQRGHKLLKDKQEELMRQFMSFIGESRRLRSELEEKLQRGQKAFLAARSQMPREMIEDALSFTPQKAELEVSQVPIMNLRIPQFQLDWNPAGAPYGFAHTSGDLDQAVRILGEALPSLIQVAETENTIQVIAAELEKTRRRVNALEHILIPNLEDTIKEITAKLNELERGNLVRLMKVKDIVRSH